ncbi:MAG TPA: PfkB family carbohydrate kinase [Tepidisphaeraceae bacterium]|jgi:rfaE bifunctional protein kinase chain/domain/rfaE bifunctional protein nucleotidyltransferase chain/domain
MSAAAADRKVVSLQQLLEMRARALKAGQTIVHCHGCFDIVHPGHIHHLQYAKSLGDLLVVSVSADSHVNKGVSRPLIPDDLRAKSLAALECVDAVYLNNEPTAIDLLEHLRPDLYVKGREYEKNFDPRFTAERDVVTRHGGRVVFSSNDIVYSSTALINGMAQPDPFKDEKLRRFCQRYDLSGRTLQQLLHRFRDQRVVVIGDYILDRYHFCDATGVAGEGPMMALRAIDQKDFDGGGAIIAQHLAGLGAAPTLVTALAEDDVSHQAELRLRGAGVNVTGTRNRRKLVAKHRYLVDETKLFKVDEGSASPLDSREEEQLAEQILSVSDGAAAVIFADFGYGLITGGLLQRIMQPLRSAVPIITADVSGRQSNLTRFQGVDLLCPTEREVRETLHDFSSGLGAVVANLLNLSKSRQAIITLGKQGLVSFDWPAGTAAESGNRLRSEYVPALATHSVDPLGAGDALLAVASLTLAVGGSLQASALLGSLAAAMEVQSVGNLPITMDRLAEEIVRRDCEPVLPARLAS